LHCKELQDNPLDLDRVRDEPFRSGCFAPFVRVPLISDLVSKSFVGKDGGASVLKS